MKQSKKTKSKLARRITWRVILIMAFFSVFIIAAIFFFNLVIAGLNAEMRANQLIDGVGGKLEYVMKVVEVSAKNNVAEIEEHLDSPQSVYDAMERELRLNNDYLGCGIGFEPDYFPSQGRWFEPYVKYRDSIHIERKQIGSAKHDYFSQQWYIQGQSHERGEGSLTAPYFDKDGGESILCTYVSPIFDHQGRRVAVLGIDLSLNWLKEQIIKEEERFRSLSLLDEDSEEKKDYPPFFIQVLDNKGNKIAGSYELDKKALKNIIEKDTIDNEVMYLKGEAFWVSSKRLTRTGWTLVVSQHMHFVLLNGYAVGVIILFFSTLGGIVIFFFTSRSIRRAIKPLGFLSESAQEVAQGYFDTQLPTYDQQDEIAQLRDSFDTMQQSLKHYVEELKDSTAAKASIESELNVAHNIQMSMLPKLYPPFPERNDIELYGIQKPAKAVGGDLFDFFIRDEKLFFCIGDVSGKGVPASLVMAVTRTLFRNVSAHDAAPGRIVETMNKAISEGNDNNMFVTLFIGILDLQTGHLRYCNAGHDAPYVSCKKLPCHANLPVGVMADMNFTEQETDIAPNTIIFLYTDGLTEAENAQHELLGEQRITEIIKANSKTPNELIEAMTETVRQFVGDTEQNDDITMLAIKYTK